MPLFRSTRLFRRSIFFTSAVAGSLIFVSCDKMGQGRATDPSGSEAAAVSDTAGTTTAVARPQEPLYEITYRDNSPYQGLTPPSETAENPFEKVAKISQTYAGSPNWADKHADIKSLLLQSQNEKYYYILQQQAANEMLRNELFQHYYQEPGNNAVLKTIGEYTEHLVEAKSEDAELIYKCLRALQGYWEKEKIAQVALRTAARVKARPIQAAADTTTRNGSYRQIYARELQKMGDRLTRES